MITKNHLNEGRYLCSLWQNPMWLQDVMESNNDGPVRPSNVVLDHEMDVRIGKHWH